MNSTASPRFPNRLFLLAVPCILFAVLLPSCNLLFGMGMMKLRFGCLPEGTRIDTVSGTVAIEDLKTGDQIIGYDGSQVRIAQIHQYQENADSSRYLKLQFSNGGEVTTSPRHRISGAIASSYEIGDSCGSLTVTGISPVEGVSRSYDLLTGDAGYRIGGIPVNSMIAEMAGRR